jgi:hypothetical protein
LADSFLHPCNPRNPRLSLLLGERNRAWTAALSREYDKLLVNTGRPGTGAATRVLRKLLRDMARLSRSVITHDQPNHRSLRIRQAGIPDQDFAGIRTSRAD